MAFFKYSIVLALFVGVFAEPKPQYFGPPPPPPFAPRFGPLGYPGAAPVPVPVPVPVGPRPVPVPVPVPRLAPVPLARAEAQIPIVSQSFDIAPDGAYSFSFEAADGTSRQENGVPKAAPGSEAPGGHAVQGRFTHPSELGPVAVEYIADENGYQPSGPSVHPEIQKAVAAQVAQARAEGPIYNGPGPVAYSRPVPVPVPVPGPYAGPFGPRPVPVPVPVPAPGYPYRA